MENKLIMLVGLPASGKSTYTKELIKKYNAVLISTDAIREELFGDESIQKDNNKVFYFTYSRIEKELSLGRNVIFDATNVEREKRMNVIKKYPGHEVECYYFDTPFEICLERNKKRKRIVPEQIMNKLLKKIEIPIRSEGFSKINIIHTKDDWEINKEDLMKLIDQKPKYEDVFNYLKKNKHFKKMINFDQENPHHSMTLCEHTYYVYEYISEFFKEDEMLSELKVAALFHDIGKLYTKKYKELKGYYSYYGHENVSSYMVFNFLNSFDFEDEFKQRVLAIVEKHMMIAYGGQEGESKIYRENGSEILTRLYMFNTADKYAK